MPRQPPACDIPIYGYIYDVKNGKLIEVPEATKSGQARP
jgi:carbonic anhydrase